MPRPNHSYRELLKPEEPREGLFLLRRLPSEFSRTHDESRLIAKALANTAHGQLFFGAAFFGVGAFAGTAFPGAGAAAGFVTASSAA